MNELNSDSPHPPQPMNTTLLAKEAFLLWKNLEK